MTAGSQIPRVVVTGLGVLSPIGIGKDPFWQNLLDGTSGVDFLKSFPSENLPSQAGCGNHRLRSADLRLP